MPTYRITSPDGQKFDVTAPDGATQDQVLEYAKSHWGKSAPSKPAKEPPPIAGMQGPDDPGFWGALPIAAGRTIDRVSKGMQQLYHGATGDEQALTQLKDEAAADDRAYAPLREARPWATGIGESLPSMIMPLGGGATLGSTALRMGLSGAIPGLMEYGTAGQRLERGAWGGAAGAAFPFAVAGVKTGHALLEPVFAKGRDKIVGRTLNRAAGENADTVASRLASARELVPGSRPTAGQVAESGGIAALERSAAAANPEAYAQRAMEQSGARVGAVRGIAGDDAAMAAAEGARDAASRGLYDQAKAATVNNSPEVAGLIDRMPDSVVNTAKRLAKIRGESLKVGKDLPGRDVAQMFGGVPMIGQAPATTSQYSGKALHYIKLALDDEISKAGTGGLGSVEKEGLMSLKDDFLGMLDTQIPPYGQARAAYAQASKPINQMEIGQELLKKVQPALSEYGALGRSQGETFARALRDADQTAAKATGFKSARMADVMSPQQMGTLNSVAQDLARKSNAENLGKGTGSDTFQKLSMANIAAQSGMPSAVGGLLDAPGISGSMRWMYRDVDDKMKRVLADALLEPAKAAQLMRTAEGQKLLKNNPKLRKAIEQSVLRSGLLAAPLLNPIQVAE
jgi:hypothetical protein